MKCLIKKAKIIDAGSKYHGKQMDILVLNSRIEEIKSSITAPQGVKQIVAEDLHCSLSWMDIGTQIGEPGLEHRETLDSIASASRKGGYGIIASLPNTNPVVQHKSSVKYILDHSVQSKLTILPIAAITENAEGKEITEMYDLHNAGSVAFSDGLKSIQHSGILARSLEYVKPFNGLIIHHAHEKTLSTEAQMHEGEVSTMLGMRGTPALAETMIIKRDIDLLQYTGGKLCIHAISTNEAVKLIREAKKNIHHLSCTVPYLNLIKTDADLMGYDTNLKVQPPLRRKSDIMELIKGLKDNTIDAIISNHVPIEEEGKKLEFPYAKFGASGIETVFSALNTYCAGLDLETIIQKLTTGPRAILSVDFDHIQVGNKADLTLFSPTMNWTFDKTKSTSKNNPFLGHTLKGKVIEVIQ